MFPRSRTADGPTVPPETPRLCGVRRPLTARHSSQQPHPLHTPRSTGPRRPVLLILRHTDVTVYVWPRFISSHLQSRRALFVGVRRWLPLDPPDTRIRRSARLHLPPTSHLLTYGLDEFSSPSQYLVSDPPSGASSGHAVSCAPSTFRRFGCSRCCGREASLWRRPARPRDRRLGPDRQIMLDARIEVVAATS